MTIIEVIPIAKGVGVESLSYFTSLSVAPGALVKVPLRSKMVPALVIAVHRAEDMRSELRNADFSLKKIEGTVTDSFLTPEWFKVASSLAYYYATTTGAVLHALTPQSLLVTASKNPEALRKPFGVNKALHTERADMQMSSTPQGRPTLPTPPRPSFKGEAMQGSDADRYSAYRSHIRQEFARKNSVFIMTPTHEDARRTYDEIVKGLEGYIFILTGSTTPKELVRIWTTAVDLLHPIVIIGTAQFLCIPREDIQTLIIERENSRHYTLQHRPFIDMRVYAESYARHKKITLIIGDTVLRTETLYRTQSGEFLQANPFALRAHSTAEDIVIDMRDEQQNGASGGSSKKSFRVLSQEAIRLLAETKEKSERMVILATRRGLAPSIVCGDCHNIVMCSMCSIPVVLHSSSKGSFFMCHRCGERRSADEACGICGGWKLGTVGIGIDLVQQKVADEVPEIKIFKIDSDTVKTETALKNTLAKFYDTPGSVLIGTEMMLPYLRQPFEHSLIASVDSLLSIPDFRIYEKILVTLTRIRSYATRTFIIQTRTPKDSIFDYARKGNLIDFYRRHIEERKQFNYPPFATLIKITIEGERKKISDEMHGIQNLLAPHTVDVFPAFTHTVKGKYVLHGLIALPKNEWPHEELITRLRNLPQHITVKVDPESLL